jgi:Tol biopolymer transport system component/DNA-binding winged helix-turn-helix (wHTH) protein
VPRRREADAVLQPVMRTIRTGPDGNAAPFITPSVTWYRAPKERRRETRRKVGVGRPVSPRYLVDDLTIDSGCFAVTRAGQRLALEPKAVTLLLHLLAHRDRVVTKGELTELLWKDTFVTPNALTRLVAQLRRELGDVASEPRFIQTVHRRGYRFVGPVRESHERPGALPAVTATPVVPSPKRRGVLIAAAAILATLAVSAVVFRARIERPERESAFASAAPRQVTASLGFDTDPAIAPDGRLLAWSSDQSGHAELYVRRLDADGNARQVTADGMQNVEPAWSPDGRWIAYHSRSRRGIWVIPAAGGTPRRLAAFGSRPAWSPDGTRVAFGAHARVMAARTQIWTVAPDGSGLAPLTTAAHPDGVHQTPVWSPDGRHLAFQAGTPGHTTIWIQRLADGRLTRVRDAHVVPAIAFGSSGDVLMWAEGSRASFGRVWRQGLDLAGGRLAGKASVDETTGPLPVQCLTIAGDRIAYVPVRLETNLWTLPLGRDGRPGTPRPLTRTTYRNTFPVFSPDGTRIAFQLKRPGSETEVWTIAPTGGEPAPLLRDNPRGFFPNWLPGGERVLAVERTEGGERFAYLDARSGQRDALRAVNREKHPRLSPDGRHVAFHAPVEGTLRVFVAPIAGGPSRQLTFSPTDAAYPSWSPDGRRLAVEVRQGEDVHIAVMSAAGGPLEVITSGPGLHWPHSWAPDGDRIAFAGEHDGRWEIYSISTTTREIEQLTNFAAVSGYVRYPAWSPRDTSIAFERAEARGNVWITTARISRDDQRGAGPVDVDRVKQRQR